MPDNEFVHNDIHPIIIISNKDNNDDHRIRRIAHTVSLSEIDTDVS